MQQRQLILRLSCVLLVAWGATASGATKYVEGDVIVTFKPGESAGTARAATERKALLFVKHFARLSAKRGRPIALVRNRSKTTAQLITSLQADPAVELAEPDYLRWVNADPNDARFGELWGLKNTGQIVNGSSGTAAAEIRFLDARNMARSPLAELVVGVIDTGVDYIHPDLIGNIWSNPVETRNGVDDDGNGYVDDVNGYDFASGDADPSDSGNHGTHVAGTIAAVGENAIGVIGVNDRARILALKVSTDGSSISSSAAIAAIEYATALKVRGVNIVALNASYGGGGSTNAERAAIQAAGDAGIILCVAAGNSSANNDTTATYPASYRLPNMIVVAATDQNDALSSFSNYGATTVDLAAPGSNILSTQPSTVSLQVGGTTYASSALTFSNPTPGVTGQIINCGTGNTAAEFPSAVRGNIALIQRGTQTFAVKVTNAMNAGAKAAIIYNNVSGSFGGTLQTAGNWIPSYAISQADGQAIKNVLPQSGGILVTGNYLFLSGTSMATPHVAGAVAFAAMNFPSESVALRRQRLLVNVDMKSGLQGKVATAGRLNVQRILDPDNNGVPDWRPVITSTTLPLAVTGENFSFTLASIGGEAPYVWDVADGALPGGLTLDGSGTISGVSKGTGVSTFTARVTDAFGVAATQAFTLRAGASGPLDHFSWDYVPDTVFAGTRFAVKLTARDDAERIVVADPSISSESASITVTNTSGGAPLSFSPTNIALKNGAGVGYLTIPQTGNVTLTATEGGVSSTSKTVHVESGVSSANDGIPDAWKSAYGLVGAASAAASDSDGDGLTNQQEFLAGTNPKSSSSALQITSASKTGNSKFSLTFPAVAGKLYRVAETSDFSKWTPILPEILAPATGPQQVTLDVAGEQKRFFRIEIVP